MPLPECTFWARRSPIMQTATIFMYIGVMVHLIAIATPFWVVWPDWAPFTGHVGLFTFLYQNVPAPPPSMSLMFLFMSLLSFTVACSMTVANLCCLLTKYIIVVPALITFFFVAGLTQFIPLTILMMSQVHLVARISWSTWLATFAAFSYMMTSGLCVFEYTKERHRFHLPQLETDELEQFVRRYNRGRRNRSRTDTLRQSRHDQETQTVMEMETENL